MPSVFVLKPGSIKRDECGRILDARSSVSLIVCGEHKIIVDSGLEGEEGGILKALKALNVRPEKVDLLVNTHSHPDHCGNNHLFSMARVLAARDGDAISPGVWIMATPGHSMDSISVVVEANLTIVIAGDALPTFGNFQKMVPPALHIDRTLAEASMKKILAFADIVVPGHDFPFYVHKAANISLPGPIGDFEHSAGSKPHY
jgi:glyoxylase-like metal-dependent hydrolase (beta-lactamase superfamily II)